MREIRRWVVWPRGHYFNLVFDMISIGDFRCLNSKLPFSHEIYHLLAVHLYCDSFVVELT
jgi:hypothetical protein